MAKLLFGLPGHFYGKVEFPCRCIATTFFEDILGIAVLLKESVGRQFVIGMSKGKQETIVEDTYASQRLLK